MHRVTIFIELDFNKSKFDLCICYGFGLGGFFSCLFSPYDSMLITFLRSFQLNNCSSYKEKVGNVRNGTPDFVFPR